MNLCIYFPEHALFQKQSGEFEISSWFISYELFCPASGPKMCIFCHKFTHDVVDQTFQIDLDSGH